MTQHGVPAGWPDDDVWNVLEVVAVYQGRQLPPEAAARVATVRTPGFDHGRLVEQAMRHGLLPAYGDFVNRHGYRSALPDRLWSPLMSFLRLAEHRRRVLTAEATRIASYIGASGARAAFTKGVIVGETLYDGLGIRTFNDIDMMVAPESRDVIADALVGLGFSPDTTFDPVARELRPLARASKRMYQLSPDHLPHFHRLLDDGVVLGVAVDVANSLTWHDSAWQVPMEDVMAALEHVNIGGDDLPTLSLPFTFLFLVLHLFREGWIERTMMTKDVSLSQFVDVHRQWEAMSDEARREVRTRIASYGIAAPVAWVAAHTDELFGSDIVAELALGAEATPAWLASAQNARGHLVHWHGDMRNRLRSPSPPTLTAS